VGEAEVDLDVLAWVFDEVEITYNSVFPQQVFLADFFPVEVAQGEWAADLGLAVAFAHFDNPLSLEACFLILEVGD